MNLNRLILLIFVTSIAGCQSVRLAPISLWTIESDVSQVYLMGSVHALKPDFYPLYSEFDQAFEQAETLVVEVDLGRVPEHEIAAIMRRLGTYQSGSLRENLSLETWNLLVKHLEKGGQQPGAYDALRPWFVSLQISMQLLAAAGFDPELGIDQHYLTRARGKKSIEELESFSEQIRILSADSPEIQDLSLRTSLQEVDRAHVDLARLISAWQQGDMGEIYSIATKPARQYPQLEVQLSRLLDERNVRMANKIKQYLNRPGSYLVIIGALHMGGSNGIIKLLQQDYEVVQMRRAVKQG